jgi:hypothetical protein
MKTTGTVLIHGTSIPDYTARIFLKGLKRAYIKNIDKESFIYDNQQILTAYAKYLILYLEEELNTKK